MIGVKIEDKKQSNGGGSYLSFSLKEILAVIGERVLTSRWRCRDLTFYSPYSSGKNTKMKLSGEEIIKFANDVGIILDGRFEARGEGAAKYPWLIIVAHDSSWYEVWSSKTWVIEKIKEHLKDVSEITAESA